MRPGTVGLWLLAASAAAGVEVHAQAPRLGDHAPALDFERWVRRQPIEVDFECAPRPRVIAFVPPVRVQYLRAMKSLAVARALAGELASIVVVLPPDDVERMMDWRGRRPLPECSFAVDAGGRTRASFQFDGPVELPYVALVDDVGRLCWSGELTVDLSFDTQRMLAGDFSPAVMQDLQALRDAQRNAPGDAVERALRDGAWHWLPHSAALGAIPPEEFAVRGRAALRRAIAALDGRPVATARVLRAALERDARLPEVPWAEEALEGALRSAPFDPIVARTGLEWFAKKGDRERASRWAIGSIEAGKGVPRRLAEVARRLAAARDLKLQRERLIALDLATASGSTDVSLLHDRFMLLLVDLGDREGAMGAGRSLIEAYGPDARILNSFAWRLMTEEPFTGHMDALALTAARAMTRSKDWRTYWRVDTLALACFENGLFEEAVKWQNEAVEQCDAGSRARYTERLRRYEAALASVAQPAK